MSEEQFTEGVKVTSKPPTGGHFFTDLAAFQAFFHLDHDVRVPLNDCGEASTTDQAIQALNKTLKLNKIIGILADSSQKDEDDPPLVIPAQSSIVSIP